MSKQHNITIVRPFNGTVDTPLSTLTDKINWLMKNDEEFFDVIMYWIAHNMTKAQTFGK